MTEFVPFVRARALAMGTAALRDVDLISLDDAVGRTLAESVIASDDLVPFARAAMDGYAVAARDAVPGLRLPVRGRIVAGDRPVVHARGGATAIATGAPLPEGADAVIPWEDVEVCDSAIAIARRTVPGAHVFPPGDDARCGDILAACGDAIEPGTLGLLAATGCAQVRVRRRPRVRIICTGDELVAPGCQPEHDGQIFESNGVVLRALVTATGAEVCSLRHCGDEPDEVRSVLQTCARDADLVITTGGASSGPRDAVKPALDALGARFAFRSVALRPARPTALAHLGTAAVVVLPGNPSAAVIGFHAIARPLLAVMLGRDMPTPLGARLRGTVRAKAERTYAVLADVYAEGGAIVADVLPNQCSSLAGNAARANGMVLLPPGERTYVDDTLVSVELIGALRERASAFRNAVRTVTPIPALRA